MGARTRSAHVARGRPRQPPRDDRDPVRLPGVVLRRRPGDEPGHPENDHGVAARQHRRRLHGGRVLPVGRGRGGAGDRQGAQTGTWWGSLLSLVVFGAIALPAIRGVFWWAMAAPIASLPARWRTGLCPPNAGTPPASPPTPPCVGLLALLAVVGSIIRWVPYTGPGMPTGGRLAFAPVRDHARDPGSGRWALGAVVQRAQKWGFAGWLEFEGSCRSPVVVDSLIRGHPGERLVEVLRRSQWRRGLAGHNPGPRLARRRGRPRARPAGAAHPEGAGRPRPGGLVYEDAEGPDLQASPRCRRRGTRGRRDPSFIR